MIERSTTTAKFERLGKDPFNKSDDFFEKSARVASIKPQLPTTSVTSVSELRRRLAMIGPRRTQNTQKETYIYTHC